MIDAMDLTEYAAARRTKEPPTPPTATVAPNTVRLADSILANHTAILSAVSVNVGGNDDEVTLAVHNHGAAIPEEQLDGIFNAMKLQTASTVVRLPCQA